MVATVLIAATLFVATPADAEKAPSAGVSTVGWSCTVPPGYTFTKAHAFYGACGISGYYVTMFWIMPPSNGMYACTIPDGWTYDGFMGNSDCSTMGRAPIYHILVPTNGMIACLVPNNFTYTGTRLQQYNCSPFGPAALYYLAVPTRGLWACTVPRGFTYSRYINPAWGCAISPQAPGVSFLLQ